MKIILNKCYGGFSPSHAAYLLYAEKKGIPLYMYEQRVDGNFKKINKDKRYSVVHYFTKDFGDYAVEKEIDWDYNLYLTYEYRTDPVLIEVVEELGKKASNFYSNLVVVDIPDGMDYVIDDYDGVETLHEKVRTW